jgi:hypothetical protein
MGILDVFRSKKQEPVEEKTHVIELEALPAWMDEHFGSETETAKKSAMKMGSDAIEALSTTKERLLRLEKSSFGGKDKAYAAANMAKNSFVRRGLSIIGGLRFSGPGKETYAGLTEFSSKLRDALKQINKTSPKQLFLLSRYFKNDSKGFMDSLKDLEHKTTQLSDFLKSDGKVIMMAEKLELHKGRLNELLARMSKLNNQQKDIEAEIAGLEKSKKEASEELDGLLKSREWKELSELEESILKNKEELSELETEANEVLGSAKRPLKKLRHLLESREAFPDNPFRDIVLAGREAWLAGMLETAKEHVADGSISLKPREAERLDEVGEWLKSGLPKAIERHSQLSEKAEELKRSAAKFGLNEKRSGIEKQLSETEEKLKKRWAELDSKIKDAKLAESDAEELKQTAEKLVFDSGSKKLEIRIHRIKNKLNKKPVANEEAAGKKLADQAETEKATDNEAAAKEVADKETTEISE